MCVSKRRFCRENKTPFAFVFPRRGRRLISFPARIFGKDRPPDRQGKIRFLRRKKGSRHAENAQRNFQRFPETVGRPVKPGTFFAKRGVLRADNQEAFRSGRKLLRKKYSVTAVLCSPGRQGVVAALSPIGKNNVLLYSRFLRLQKVVPVGDKFFPRRRKSLQVYVF